MTIPVTDVRKRIKRAGDAAIANNNNGRFVPIVVPKRPEQ